MGSSAPLNLLDARQRADICAILALGGTRSLASRYVGCDPLAIRRTAAADPAFLEQLELAEARHEILHLKLLADAFKAKPDWRASAWVLERKYPARYAGRKADTLTTQQVSQLVSSFADVVLDVVPAEFHRRILKRLSQLMRQAGKKPPATKAGDRRLTQSAAARPGPCDATFQH